MFVRKPHVYHWCHMVHLVQLSSLIVLSAHRVCVLWNSSSDKSLSKGLKSILGFLKKWLIHTNFNWYLGHLIIGIHSWKRGVQHESILCTRILNFSMTYCDFWEIIFYGIYSKIWKIIVISLMIFAVICFWFHLTVFTACRTPQLNMNFSKLHMHGI